jgi:hypothetical protein
MELSDHTIITILRAAWVLEFAAWLVLDRTARALLRYLEAHPSAAVGPAAEHLPASDTWWLWRRAGGSYVVRFVWSAEAGRTQDPIVRRYVMVSRTATAVIVATLVVMLLATASQPSRHWSLVQAERRPVMSWSTRG